MIPIFKINKLDEIILEVEQWKNKLVIVAGSSASWKSYFAHSLAEALKAKGKNVLEISSDDYYTNETGLKYMLYGTFDHPNLIEYPLLTKNLEELIKTDKTEIPTYSFVERRRVGYKKVEWPYDYIIVEGLYTISQIQVKEPNTKIFVHTETEDIIFRRLVRDQERVKEPLYMILQMLGKVFPMWNIFGQTQKQEADFIVDNDYEILENKGTLYQMKRINGMDEKELWEPVQTFDLIEYHYDDESRGNWVIVVSEVYKKWKELLDSVQISKTKEEIGEHHEQGHAKFITLSLYQPGILTDIHSLLQCAGLKCGKIVNSIEKVFEKNWTKVSIIEKMNGKKYIKTEQKA